MAPRLTSPRLVGREAALEQLGTRLDIAVGGAATTVLVTGSAGVGVSRFLAEVGVRLGAGPDDWTVLSGRAVPSGADSPYGMVVRALGPVLDTAAADDLERLVGGAGTTLAPLFPQLAARPRATDAEAMPAGAVASELRQARLFEAILGVLRRLAEAHPVVLAFEDLHVADAATRGLVSFIARNATDQRLCLIGTYAPDELTRAAPQRRDLATIQGSPMPPARIDLPPLGRDDLVGLIEAINGERPTAATLVLVAEHSAGRPIHVEELLAARRELTGASLVGTLDEIVVARLGLRSPECRRALRLLALASRPLTRDRLAEIATTVEADRVRRPPRSTAAPRHGDGILDADLAAGLAEAVEHGFVTEIGTTVEIRHELIARAIAADVLPAHRPRHHAAIAGALADEPAAAARHWRLAWDPARTRAAALAAADHAAVVNAPREELACLEAALELADAPAAGPPLAVAARTELHVRAAAAAAAAGQAARAVAYVEAALGATGSERAALGRLHELLGFYRRAAGDHAGALQAHRRAVELVPATGSEERARALASLAQVLMLQGTFSEAETVAGQAIELASALGDRARLEGIHATTTLGVALGWGHDPDRGFQLLEEARDRARVAGDFDELFRIYANLTTVLDLLGRREEAVRIAFEGLDEARRAGLDATYGNFLRGNAAESLFLTGRWRESREFATAALAWSPAGEAAFTNSIVNLAVIEIETRAGENAGRLLGQLLMTLETINDPQHAVPVHRAAASLALWLGDLGDARRAAERGWALVRSTEDWILAAKMAATVAEVDAAATGTTDGPGDLSAILAARGRTGRVVTEARRLVERAGVPPSAGSRLEAEALLRVAAAFQDRIDGVHDPRAWDAAARAWRTHGNPYEVARARWRQAEATLSADRARAARNAARTAIEEAATIALELDARPLLRELGQLAGRARIPLPRAARRLLDDELADAGRPAARPASQAPPGPPVDGRAGEAGMAGSAVAALRTSPESAARPANPFGLSRREQDVLNLVADGRTNREIGERLFISQKTVGVHVGNILAKLDVSGRVEAATVALRLGLVDPGPPPS